MGSAWRFAWLALVFAAHAVSAQPGAGEPGAGDAARRAAAEQKLKLADQMLFRSPGARRVAASGNEEAARLLAGARSTYASARGALDGGNAAAADELAAEALRQLGIALRLVPEAGREGERVRYARILNAVQAFQGSQFLGALRTGQQLPPETERVRELVAQAQAKAEAEDFAEALRLMDQAAELILAVAPRLMVAPASGLSGAAALEWQGTRYQGYEDLALIGAARGGSAAQERRLQGALDRARSLNMRAQDLALGGRYDEAVTASQDAIAVLQEALRAADGNSLK